MKIFRNVYIAVLFFILSVAVFGFAVYHYCFGAVGNSEILKTVVIESGSGVDAIGKTLVDKGLIRNKLAFKVYVKLSDKTNLKAGTYSLSEDMNLMEIVDILEEGGTCEDVVKITFKEGLHMRDIAEVIASNTNNTEDMVYNLLKDKEYLKTLIDKYWFLTDDILDDGIYYALEGYLFPDTYYFCTKDVDVETIFGVMLDEMEKKLKNYKKVINDSDYSFHEILSLASIVESEAITFEDRKKVAQVLYRRLDKNMSFDCDVTTYYGIRVDKSDRDLTRAELDECNDYNTRCATFKKIPISPICNPSLDSIKATLEPSDTNYEYFVADINGKIYFNKDLNAHNNTIAKLKREKLWYTYD